MQCRVCVELAVPSHVSHAWAERDVLHTRQIRILLGDTAVTDPEAPPKRLGIP
jgi:hypothetical protein